MEEIRHFVILGWYIVDIDPDTNRVGARLWFDLRASVPFGCRPLDLDCFAVEAGQA